MTIGLYCTFLLIFIMLLNFNNKSDYVYLLKDGEDFHIPDKPLPKIEIRLNRIIRLQSVSEVDSDEYFHAVKNLVWLNRFQDTAFLTSAIPGVLKLKSPDNKRLIKLIKGYIKENRDGLLKPEYNGVWWIISKKGFNGQGKHKLFEERMNIQKISDTINELKLSVGKITQRKVSDLTGLSIRTIKTRWPQFKDDVKEFNSFLKQKEFYIDDTELS